MDFKEQLRNFQGLWISKELWFNQDLSIQEKMFLLEINSLDNKNHCHASNNYFSQFFQLSPNRCSEIINKLQKKGLIEIKYIKENRQIKERIIKVLEKGNRVLGKSTDSTRVFEMGYSKNSEERSNSIRSNSIKNKQLSTIIKEMNLSTELEKTLLDFIDFRIKTKSPLTQRALTLLLNQLDKLANTEQEKIDILNQSIMNGWKGVFPLKNKPQQSNMPSKRDYQAPLTQKELDAYDR